MRTTIKGRIYDTNKATLIAKVDNGFCLMDERYMEERLYQIVQGLENGKSSKQKGGTLCYFYVCYLFLSFLFNIQSVFSV